MYIADLPYISTWFHALPTVYIVFIGICCFLLLLITVMTLWMCRTIHYCVGDEFTQSDLYFVTCMPLFISAICLIGNIIPRSSPVLYAVGLIYLMLCLYIVLLLTTKIYGSRKAVSKYLEDSKQDLELSVRPYCCCCRCLPHISPTTRNLRWVSYLVLQTPLVRIGLQIVIIVFNVEGVPDSSKLLQVFNGIGVASTLFAVYGCHIIIQAAQNGLASHNMVMMFRCVDTIQLVYTFQKFILDLIALNGGMPGLSMAPPSMVVRFWHNTAMIVYLTFVSFIFFRNLKPGKSAFYGEMQKIDGVVVPITDL